MPYETTWETNGISQKFWGVVSSPELFDSLKNVHQDPRFNSIQYVIKDYLSVDVFDVGLKTVLNVRAFSMATQKTNPDLVVAIVTTNPQIVAASTAASSYRFDSYPRKIFSTVAEARAWIEDTKRK